MPAAADDAVGRLVSLWFADDSTVVETDITRLQWLVDTLGDLLELIGLIMNILKTKLMITMGQKANYGPTPGAIYLKVYGKEVETVTEFPHLGTMLNSRGNRKDAWGAAKRRAALAYHDALAGGGIFPFWQCGIDDDGGESDDMDVYGRADGNHGRGRCVCFGLL